MEIFGDTRSCTNEVQELIERRMREICENICRMNDASCDFAYMHEFAPAVNWEECAAVAVNAAQNVVGPGNTNGNCVPWMASEDFGTFLTKIPGCFVFLGNGKHKKPMDNIMLHNSLYDYNDDVIMTGAEFFAELISVRLPKIGPYSQAIQALSLTAFLKEYVRIRNKIMLNGCYN